MENKTVDLLKRPIVHLLLISYLCIAAYSNSFKVPFHFDDISNILRHPGITDIKYFITEERATLSKRSKMVAEDEFVRIEYSRDKHFNSRLFGFFTFYLNYKFNGLHVGGYHSLNLAIHILNAILVYYLVILTFKTPYMSRSILSGDSRLAALFSALLFAGHPIQTQAVTYIIQRFTSLATLLYLSALIFYIKWRTSRSEGKGGFWFYFIAALSAILAMKTKEIAFTIPLTVLLYDFMFFESPAEGRRGMLKRFLYTAPLFLTMLVVPLSLIDFDKPLGEAFGELSQSTRLSTHMSRTDYLLTQFRVIITYIRLLFFPVNQNLDYDYPLFHSFTDPQVLFSFISLAFIFASGILLYNRLRLVSFGVFWFFLTLSVESSFIPILDVIFEHRLYLPSVGVAISFTYGIFYFYRKFESARARKSIIVILVLIVAVLSVATFMRNRVWASHISLWEDTARKSSEKPRVLSNLATSYANAGEPDKAIEHYNLALKLDPTNADALNGMGVSYYNKRMPEQAIKYYLQSLRYSPEKSETHNNIGLAYLAKNQYDTAIEHLKTAIKLNNNFELAYYNLGVAYSQKGDIDSAIESLKKALALKPAFLGAHIEIGILYRKNGVLDKAVEHLRVSLMLDPQDARTHYELGSAYKTLGQTDKAQEHFTKAFEIDPEYLLININEQKPKR